MITFHLALRSFQSFCVKMFLFLTLALFVGLASSRPSDKAIVDVDPNKYCGCSTVDRPQCGCCVDLEEIIQEDYTVCTNLTYVEEEYGVQFTLTINGEVLLNETISGKNPPALCEGLKDVADICVQVYNMSYEKDNFGGCLRIYGDVVTRVLNIELGCYYMPLSDSELIETAVDEQALVHSLFQIGNNAKDLILDEMHKWSHKDGDLGEIYRHHDDGFPVETLLESVEKN